MNKFKIKDYRKYDIASLSIAIGLNFSMFVTEIILCWIINSISMMSDAVDSFGDALTYSVALYAVVKLQNKKEDRSVILGIVQVVIGCFILEEIIRQYAINEHDDVQPMFLLIISFFALAVNLLCAVLLYLGSKDKNVKASFWFSAIDCFANAYTIIAAIIIWNHSNPLPDLIGGIIFFLLVVWAAVEIFVKNYKYKKISKT
ncbi:MAG: cation transporter [Mycoplasmataceae bacterium]|nr:cation transporter [Mycoplasmataceae bacterium]